MTSRFALPFGLVLGAMAAGLAVLAQPVEGVPVRGDMPEAVWARVESTVRQLYGPDAKIFDVFWYGGDTIEPEEVEEARRDLSMIVPEEDPVWFGANGALMDARTGHKGVVAPSAGREDEPAGAYLVIVQRPPGTASRVAHRDDDDGSDDVTALPERSPAPAVTPKPAARPPAPRTPTAAPPATTPVVPKPQAKPQTPPPQPPPRPEPAASASDAGPAISFGPILGVNYVSVDGHDFVSPTLGGSVRYDLFTLFVAGGRQFRQEGDDDRMHLAGLRYGPTSGPFAELVVLDARQVVVDREAWSHRARGGTLGLGYQDTRSSFQWSLTGGAGAFDLLTPESVDSATRFGFSLAGQAGFVF